MFLQPSTAGTVPNPIGVTQSTSPWLTSRNWPLSSAGDSVAVTGTVTANQGGAPWSDDVTDRAARLLGHVTVDNASLAVTQSTSPWVTQDQRLPSALGQAAMAASLPVVIASDQSAIPITGSISATSAATASALDPAYTEGVSEALSQDLRGNLRVGGDNLEAIRESLNDLAWAAILQSEAVMFT